jgi:dynein light intermediate chain
MSNSGNSSSLVKYSNPFLIYQGTNASVKLPTLNLDDFIPIKKSQFNRKTQIFEWISDLETTNNIEEVLNTIINSRVTAESEKIWLQTPVSFPATNIEVIKLKANLDKYLIENGAKEYGVCNVREELYFQCFDEIIRQVIINYKKRGLLLFCVKEHFKSTIESFKAHFLDSTAFGIKKEIRGDRLKSDLASEISNLEDECAKLELEVENLSNRIVARKQNHADKKKVL